MSFWSKFKEKFEEKVLGKKQPIVKPKSGGGIKYFYSKKLDPSHTKLLNRTIKSNSAGKQSDVVIKYTKADGSKSERKVRPITAKKTKKGYLMLAHDYMRNDIRSFRMDRVGSIKTAANLKKSIASDVSASRETVEIKEGAAKPIKLKFGERAPKIRELLKNLEKNKKLAEKAVKNKASPNETRKKIRETWANKKTKKRSVNKKSDISTKAQRIKKADPDAGYIETRSVSRNQSPREVIEMQEFGKVSSAFWTGFKKEAGLFISEADRNMMRDVSRELKNLKVEVKVDPQFNKDMGKNVDKLIKGGKEIKSIRSGKLIVPSLIAGAGLGLGALLTKAVMGGGKSKAPQAPQYVVMPSGMGMGMGPGGGAGGFGAGMDIGRGTGLARQMRMPSSSY